MSANAIGDKVIFATNKLVMGILENIKSWLGKTKEKVEHTAEDVMNNESVQESLGKVKDTLESGMEKAENLSEALLDKTETIVTDLKSKGQEKIEEIKSNESFQNAVNQTKKTISDTADKLEDLGEKTAAQAGEFVDKLKDKGEETIDAIKSNPTVQSTITTAKEKLDQVEDKIESIGDQVKEKLNLSKNDDSVNEEE